jgi:hypothetical protein
MFKKLLSFLSAILLVIYSLMLRSGGTQVQRIFKRSQLIRIYPKNDEWLILIVNDQ